tara:strand:- start:680 stop:1129 length:450 start_codon:yes stop_codon:yes gene_type:complete
MHIGDSAANIDLYEFIDTLCGTEYEFEKIEGVDIEEKKIIENVVESSESSSSDECEQTASLTSTVQPHPDSRLESLEQQLNMLSDQVYALGNQLTILSSTVTEMQSSLHRFESQTNNTLRTYGAYLQWVDSQLSRVMLHDSTRRREQYN